ncbi:DegT/DnrJ/EryC1/StrS family aminotransferase [Sphingomonas sinipercae]|uniref:DegT/DnrJ/EryC1/StrS family aminotransferase n=1 Tax=Sphingomonas sinipercae TaxID=2714944 RepID=A0A6G7ZQZ7_9SPHN|nr:DegT/DnrJ/EryC1/StrS family aminotransferase [Sphingomonas sinipercae]
MPFIDLKSQYSALKSQIDGNIARVLDHGTFIMGPEVAEMEQALASFVDVPHCISVGSGTDALLVSLMALGIGPGDEVIVPAFTFAATAEVVLLAGATPVFVDVEPDTCNVDVAAIAASITPQTKAVMPVSLYGQPADMAEINALALTHGFAVIEDAAQSFGASYGNRRSCALSPIGCTSFFPSKPLGCYGDGGAIFVDDDAIAQACREIRVHGQSKRYHHTRLGLGGRMDTLQCAVILAKLERFEWEIERRLEVGSRYDRLIDSVGIERARLRDGRTTVFAQYTVMVDDRPRVQDALHGKGIPTAVHYPIPLHQQPAYRELSVFGDLPVAEALSQRVMSLPMHADLDEGTQDRIVEALVEAVSA